MSTRPTHADLAKLSCPSTGLIWKVVLSFLRWRRSYMVAFTQDIWGQGVSRVGVDSMFVRGCSFLGVLFLYGFGVCMVLCFQSIWGLLTISQLWPSTTSQDPSREMTKNLIWKDAVIPDSHLDNKRDIFHYNNENNQLERRVWSPRDIYYVRETERGMMAADSELTKQLSSHTLLKNSIKFK